MAARVLRAAGTLPTSVVCDDDEVAAWAQRHGAEVIWTPGLGLNGAVDAAVEQLAAGGVHQVIAAHADLPLATDLAWLARSEERTSELQSLMRISYAVFCLKKKMPNRSLHICLSTHTS